MTATAPRSGAPTLGRWLSWLVMAVVIVAALAYGTLAVESPTDEERANALEETIRCPQCTSQAVSSSETPSAQAVKVVIRDRIAAGDSDEEIRDFVASRYGREVLLTPSGRGFGALVWALPVVAAVIALAALVARFRGWRPTARRASDADRALVSQALGRPGSGYPDGDGDEARP